MIAALLMACVLAPGQMPQQPLPSLPGPSSVPVGRGGSWQLSPQLNQAQELVFRGQFHEEANGSRVQFNRAYRMETRLFVLEASREGRQLAILTTIRVRDSNGGLPPGISDPVPSAARLELVRLDTQGKLTVESGVSLQVPLEGAAALECGMFVPAPREHVGMEQDWQVSDGSRPARLWRIVGTELVNGTSCLKLVGSQRSDDWDRPRADRNAWRRTDTVWMPARLGYAVRVERLIELREPWSKEPTQRSVLRYDLDSTLSYNGPLFEFRQQEIMQAHSLAESAAPLLPAPQKYHQQIGMLLNRISNHLETQTATPYREAVLQVKRRLEAAQRGETPLVVPDVVEETPPTRAEPGQRAPDFVTSQFTAEGSAGLRTWQGRPILLVFYTPSSPLAEPLLLYAQKLARTNADRLHVLLMCVSDERGPALRQREALKLDLPILSGSGLRISYDVKTTPTLVLIDAAGILRASFVGWGPQTPVEVGDELKTWLYSPAVHRTALPPGR